MAGRRAAIYLGALAFVLTACASPARTLTHVPAKPLPAASPSPSHSDVVLPAPPAPPPPPPCAPTVRACVSLTTKQAWLMAAGVVDHGPVPISHGAPGNPTPTGTFPVSWKDEDNTSSIYGTPMPYSVFFAPGGIAFHEGSVTENSHGCVRLAPDAAKAFFNALHRGQLVQVVP